MVLSQPPEKRRAYKNEPQRRETWEALRIKNCKISWLAKAAERKMNPVINRPHQEKLTEHLTFSERWAKPDRSESNLTYN